MTKAIFTCSLCGVTTKDEQWHDYFKVGIIFNKNHIYYKNTYMPPVEVSVCAPCRKTKTIDELAFWVTDHFKTQVAGWKEGK